MTQIEKITKTQSLPVSGSGEQLPDDFEIGRLSDDRSRAASEIGAAMAHELTGPMTALLLYVGDLQQNGDRFVDANGVSLSQVADSALREAERVCSLIHRMGDYFEARIPQEAAVAAARDAIAWWSRAGGANGGILSRVGQRPANGSGRSAGKPLTRREQQVLGLVSEGFSNKEGAMLMKISYRTFECHRAEVMRKLGARNAADLVRLALLDTAGSTAEQRSA